MTTTNFPGILRRVAAFFITVALVVLALMFSVLIFAVILTAGVMVLGYLWWKTRHLRKQLRNQAWRDEMAGSGEMIKGEVIEGEVIRVADSANGDLPRSFTINPDNPLEKMRHTGEGRYP